MMRQICDAAFLFFALNRSILALSETHDTLVVPFGKSSVIDSVLDAQEWFDSKQCKLVMEGLAQPITWYWKQDSAALYLGFAYPTKEFYWIDLFIAPNDGNDSLSPSALNIHASAKLGERRWLGNNWEEWNWGNNTGWTANVVKDAAIGVAYHEFRIELAKLGVASPSPSPASFRLCLQLNLWDTTTQKNKRLIFPPTANERSPSTWAVVMSSTQWSRVKPIAQGKRFDLPTGKLFVPDYFKPESSEIALVVHFHGAAWLAEENLYKARKNAVLVSVHLGAFSSPYRLRFQNQEAFQNILDSALLVLNKEGIVSNPKIKFLCITSFSAGYGGVRELLKVQNYYDRIDAILLADGLHCSYTDSVARTLDSVQMSGFLRYAKDAAEGKKVFVVTHSQIFPGNYASTTETADYLINGIGAMRTPASGLNERGMFRTSVCEVKGFRLYGFEGETGPDHLDHFYGTWLFLKNIAGLSRYIGTDW
jgi:hypothetical protein